MHYLSTSAPCDNNSAPFHLSYLLAPTSVIPPPPGGGTAHFGNHWVRPSQLPYKSGHCSWQAHPVSRMICRFNLCSWTSTLHNQRITSFESSISSPLYWGARGGAVGWGTAIQTGRSRVRFPMEFFIDIILSVDSASNRNEYQEYFLEVKAAGA
jgi:hypothetical protein